MCSAEEEKLMEQTIFVESGIRERKSRLRGDDVISPADNRYNVAGRLIDRRPALLRFSRRGLRELAGPARSPSHPRGLRANCDHLVALKSK